MKILFLTDNFVPEYNAPATRTYEHCREWVRQGAEVTVITGVPNFPQGKIYEGYRNKWRQIEYVDGIKVIRVWTFVSPNKGVLKRAFDFFSFAVTSFLAGLSVRTDLIVATSPQILTAMSGWLLSVFKRTRWVMEVRDLWPESIEAVSAIKSNRIIRFLEKLELGMYRHAWKVVVVTDSFKADLTRRGIDTTKIFVIKNGVDLSKFSVIEKDNEILERLGLQNKFIVGYIGTHGLAHSLDFIIKSVGKIQDGSFHFLFIGDGAEKQNVVALAKSLNLKNVTFLNPVPKSEISRYLSVVDTALVPLKKSSTFESVIPSKIFEAAAMGIPVLLGVEGESRSIIESYNAGLFFTPEDENHFLSSLIDLRQRVQLSNEFARGCKKLAEDFDRSQLAIKMLNVLKS